MFTLALRDNYDPETLGIHQLDSNPELVDPQAPDSNRAPKRAALTDPNSGGSARPKPEPERGRDESK